MLNNAISLYLNFMPIYACYAQYRSKATKKVRIIFQQKDEVPEEIVKYTY